MTPSNEIERQAMNILIPVDGSPYSNAALAFMAARPFKDAHRPQIDLLLIETLAGLATPYTGQHAGHVPAGRRSAITLVNLERGTRHGS